MTALFRFEEQPYTIETYTTILDQATYLVQDDMRNGFIREVLSLPAYSAFKPAIRSRFTRIVTHRRNP
jgi:hypothetical protein